jgi:hypothetical protein
MFWIAVLGLALSWMLVKLGVMSATAGFLTIALKLALALMIIGGLIGAWAWFRRKS